MATGRNVYLAFRLTAITNKPLEMRLWTCRIHSLPPACRGDGNLHEQTGTFTPWWLQM